MRVGNFAVIIPQGKERDTGHVAVPHGTPYTPTLKNHHNNRRCDAAVTIDGKPMGVIRIPAYGSVTLERPVHDEGRFTFYKADTAEYAAAACGEVAPDLRGLVAVVFRPEKLRPTKVGSILIPPGAFDQQGSQTYRKSTDDLDSEVGFDEPLACKMAPKEEKTSGGITLPRGRKGLSAGATGLSGHSGQQFREADALDYDPEETVTITLRLVAYEPGPRPLTAAPTANPVPAAVA